jgi:hypothetical protein
MAHVERRFAGFLIASDGTEMAGLHDWSLAPSAKTPGPMN